MLCMFTKTDVGPANEVKFRHFLFIGVVTSPRCFPSTQENGWLFTQIDYTWRLRGCVRVRMYLCVFALIAQFVDFDIVSCMQWFYLGAFRVTYVFDGTNNCHRLFRHSKRSDGCRSRLPPQEQNIAKNLPHTQTECKRVWANSSHRFLSESFSPSALSHFAILIQKRRWTRRW